MSKRRVMRLRDNWKFTRTEQPDALASQCDESGWETVQVPHDWAIAGPFDRDNDMIRKVRKGQADIAESVTYITGCTGGLPHTGEGWNYKPHLYGRTHVLYPGKAMYGSETASTVSSRGEYYFPAVDEVNLRRDTLQVNSYDMSYPGWATAPDIEFHAQDTCP